MIAARNIESAIEVDLIGVRPDGTPYPVLAFNVPSFSNSTWITFSVNGKTWMDTTYYLRPNVKWSDGVNVSYE
ncbi:MAG: hypothetical protein QW735_03870 [archaeon]|nr:hypothetical protein [Candidatus Jingweiarchaeum tengchongense]